ncbi:MAG: squalene synthase HpnC [Alphaproteobacteria bacterium]|nr:squalene synthase HpnC [Alphaproteobacteria bacterium]
MTAQGETPSGKGAGDENFPVGSWLMPAALRPHIALFYAYARAIDDVADNPDLAPDVKIHRLNEFAAELTAQSGADPDYIKATAIGKSLRSTGVPAQHCLDLITAFKQDAVQSRYDTWDDLIRYCLNSAAPVGRYLIDLHSESRDAYAASDALCNALQIINHLQDCGDDFRDLDRVYIPRNWLNEAGSAAQAVNAPTTTPALRVVLNRCLDGVEALMATAHTLPLQLRNRRFAMEAAVIVRIADTLTADLRRRDPLAERVVLTKPRYLWCGLSAIVTLFWQRILGPTRF